MTPGVTPVPFLAQISPNSLIEPAPIKPLDNALLEGFLPDTPLDNLRSNPYKTPVQTPVSSL